MTLPILCFGYFSLGSALMMLFAQSHVDLHSQANPAPVAPQSSAPTEQVSPNPKSAPASASDLIDSARTKGRKAAGKAQAEAGKRLPASKPESPVSQPTEKPRPDAAATAQEPKAGVAAPTTAAASDGPAPAESQAKPVHEETLLSPGFTAFFEPDVRLGSVIAEDLDLAPFLRTLAREHRIKLVVDRALDFQFTLKLTESRTGINELLNELAHLFPISCERLGDFVYVRPLPKPDVRNDILYDPIDQWLGLDLDGLPLADLAEELTQITGKNVFLDDSVDPDQNVTSFQSRLPFTEALAFLARANGLGVKHERDIHILGRVPGVHIRNGLIDIWFENTPLSTILHAIADEGLYPMMISDGVEGTVSVDLRQMSIEALLALLLADTPFNYHNRDGVHVIGKGNSSYLNETLLVPFERVHVNMIPPMLPEPMLEGVTVMEIKEHNALLITGNPTKVRALEQVARSLDRTVPQVLLEVVVVKYDTLDEFNLGMKITSGNGQQLFPTPNFTLDGYRREGNNFTIARLPSNFTLQLEALDHKNHLRVLTKPRIASLSGKPANLVVGSTLFYRIETEELVGQENPRVRTTQKVESVEANTQLQITPWVIDDDLITVDIHTEFNTFEGAVEDNVPPQLAVSSVNSTVRLRNGETVILGGLSLDRKETDRKGLPGISRVPVLGALFRNRELATSQSQMVIYITPHIYDGRPGSPEFLQHPEKLERDFEPKKHKRKLRRKKRRKRKAQREEATRTTPLPQPHPRPTPNPESSSGT
ncbi:Bacterial type II and III secretion system protein [Sulfidibacter corallicola]|uniref:Secretin/TonB short N-terminal domain-containing protein n=1 Tax=Sulfidibacter corallicola TaxID=2818388 RepID=A0A8A4TNH4_SULCO|nr:hypothetical protein [Sulfidibacter corallicola]QTD50977.1 hypothetical protein J3U87_00780 [Sulfidibacter corallicola]